MSSFVYRLSDRDGRLLYVGVADTPAKRIAQHRRKLWGPLIAVSTTEEFPSRAEAVLAEANAIFHERPLCNVIGSTEPTPGISAEILAFWRAVDPTDWTVESASWTPTGTVRVLLDHPVLGAGGATVPAASIRDAIASVLAFTVAEAEEHLSGKVDEARRLAC